MSKIPIFTILFLFYYVHTLTTYEMTKDQIKLIIPHWLQPKFKSVAEMYPGAALSIFMIAYDKDSESMSKVMYKELKKLYDTIMSEIMNDEMDQYSITKEDIKDLEDLTENIIQEIIKDLIKEDKDAIGIKKWDEIMNSMKGVKKG